MSQKYRPYFTLPELGVLISSLEKTGDSLPLLVYLRNFRDKISVGAVQSQITLAPSMASKLGLDDSPVGTNHQFARKLAYKKWIENPSRLSVYELESAQAYRYENDLMSPEEEKEYETKFMG
jgi:hypothetical protein